MATVACFRVTQSPFEHHVSTLAMACPDMVYPSRNPGISLELKSWLFDGWVCH